MFVDYKTSNYIETNIASLDNSITPNVKHSQVHGLEADLDGINYAANTHAREEQPQVKVNPVRYDFDNKLLFLTLKKHNTHSFEPHFIHITGCVCKSTCNFFFQDWLGCIAKKTGLPRLLLSLTIFVSAIVMIWLCFTTAATAPEQKVPSQVIMIGLFVFTTKLDKCIVNLRLDSHLRHPVIDLICRSSASMEI